MKKTIKSIRSMTLIFLAVMFAFSSIPSTVSAEELTTGSCGDNATYFFDSLTGILTISGTGETTDYSNSDSPFYNNSSIKSVVIEEGITRVGTGLFEKCNQLKYVTFPESLTTIAQSAFKEADLSEIEIPKNVSTILYLAFYGNKNLQNISFSSTVSNIAFNAFQSCENVKTITVDEANEYFTAVDNVLFNKDMTELLLYARQKADTSYIVPNSVTSISDYSFEYAVNLSNIELPEGLKSIGMNAFANCDNLKNIAIPASVTDIYPQAFKPCKNLEKITVDATNENYCSVDDVLFNKSMTEIIQYPSQKADTLYTVPDSVKTIGNASFENAVNLFNVELPEGLDKIDPRAFSYCQNLKNITIPSSVVSIDGLAFFPCLNLEKIVIKNDNCEIFDGNTTIYFSVTIYANYGSTGQAYAEKYGNNFVPLCSDGTDNHNFDTFLTYTDDCLALTTTYTCTNCGYSYEENEELYGHVWGDYIYKEETRSHYRICANDETHIEEQSCNIGYTDVIEPTCTETGKITYTCSDCNGTWTEELDKLPHEYEAEVTAPTCTEQGYTTYTCKNCGDTYTADFTDALGHNFDDSERYCLNGCGEENPNYRETVVKPINPEGTTVAKSTTQKVTESETTAKATETTTHIKKSETTKLIANNDYTGSKDTPYDDFRIIPGYGQIKVTWTNDSKIEGYEVYISTDNSNYKKIADVKAKNADYYIIDHLTSGQMYYVKIKGYLHYNEVRIEMNSFSNSQSLTVK